MPGERDNGRFIILTPSGAILSSNCVEDEAQLTFQPSDSNISVCSNKNVLIVRGTVVTKHMRFSSCEFSKLLKIDQPTVVQFIVSISCCYNISCIGQYLNSNERCCTEVVLRKVDIVFYLFLSSDSIEFRHELNFF